MPLTADLTAQLKDLYKVRYLSESHVFLVKGKSVHSTKTAFNAACRRAKIEGFVASAIAYWQFNRRDL